MTKEKFEEWRLKLSQTLFHVGPYDHDDEHKIRLDEWSLIMAIYEEPKVLQNQSLKELVDYFGIGDLYERR